MLLITIIAFINNADDDDDDDDDNCSDDDDDDLTKLMIMIVIMMMIWCDDNNHYHHIKLIFFSSGENDVFGDNICHEPTVGQSAVDVIALTYCDLHWIQRDALIEVLEFYPEFANRFTKNLTLSYNLRDEVNVLLLCL